MKRIALIISLCSLALTPMLVHAEEMSLRQESLFIQSNKFSQDEKWLEVEKYANDLINEKATFSERDYVEKTNIGVLKSNNTHLKKIKSFVKKGDSGSFVHIDVYNIADNWAIISQSRHSEFEKKLNSNRTEKIQLFNNQTVFDLNNENVVAIFTKLNKKNTENDNHTNVLLRTKDKKIIYLQVRSNMNEIEVKNIIKSYIPS